MAQFQCGAIAPQKGRSEMIRLLVFVEKSLSMIAIGCVFVGIFVVGVDEASAARGWFQKSCAADRTVCVRQTFGDCTIASLDAACDTTNGAGCACENVNFNSVRSCNCQ